jgi:hypothetical protein
MEQGEIGKGAGRRRKLRISKLHNFYADQIKGGNIECVRNEQGEVRHARNYMRETRKRKTVLEI